MAVLPTEIDHRTQPAPETGLFSQMLRLWLEHNQRLLDMRMGPF